MKRRVIFAAAGFLVFVAGLLAAVGVPGSSSAQPPLPGVSPQPSPVWNVQPGQVRVYVWVWWYAVNGRRVAGKPVKIFDWRGSRLVGWQSAHAEHWRELRLKPGTRVCVKAFVKNAKTNPACRVVTNSGQKLVFVVRVGVKPTPTSPKPPRPPKPPKPPVPPVAPSGIQPVCSAGTVTLVFSDGFTGRVTVLCGSFVPLPPGVDTTVCILEPRGSVFVGPFPPGVVFLPGRLECIRVKVTGTLVLVIQTPVVVVTTTAPPTTTTVTTVTTPTTTAANQPPVADAGPPQQLALVGGSVTFALNGAGSRDPDGRIVSFVWTGTVDPPDVANPSVTVSQPGVYTFRLTVTDDRGATDTDDTTVSVIGEPPG